MPTPAGTRFLSAIRAYRLAPLQCATDKSFRAPFVKALEPLARFCSSHALGASIPPASNILRYGCCLKYLPQSWWISSGISALRDRRFSYGNLSASI